MISENKYILLNLRLKHFISIFLSYEIFYIIFFLIFSLIFYTYLKIIIKFKLFYCFK